jgi:hypothetical protein
LIDEWISIEDRKPENGQHVYYFFDILGVFEGHYEELFCEELGSTEEVFHGRHGFLGGGEVTHWMPYRGEKPKRPY